VIGSKADVAFATQLLCAEAAVKVK